MAGRVLAEQKFRGSRYAVASDRQNRLWYVVDRRDVYPLDLDRRHERLFLSPSAQRDVGIDGLIALEQLARVLMPRRAAR